ncbi:MAG: dienelactone hydrolase family protein [Patescibacteria group bacterium]|nr:dienelactone hydrolase family protein [Patescibacteria group bacterium]
MNDTTIAVRDGSEMRAYVARPDDAPEKGIIVLQEAFGVTDYIRRMADRFAERGFLAVAPELFHRTAPAGTELSYTDYPSVAPHMQALTPDGLAADLKACYDWLLAEGVPTEKVAAIGFCMGGRAAFLANETLPLAASVSFYGGGIADQLLDRVSDLSGPQLLFWGGEDANIPQEKTDAVAAALRAAGKTFTEKTFPGAGHAFARDVGDHYDPAAAAEAWTMTDAFLAKYIA